MFMILIVRYSILDFEVAFHHLIKDRIIINIIFTNQIVLIVLNDYAHLV
jgi:hypothetical protein